VYLQTSGIPPPEASDNTTLDVNRREEGRVEANSSSVEIIVIDDTDDEKSETEDLTPFTVVESSNTVPNDTSLSDDTEEVEAETINNIKALGFQDSTAVKACLIASKGDSNIAVDYLLNGIPPNLKITGNNDTTACDTAESQDQMTLSSLQSKIRNVSSHKAKKSFGIRTMNGKPTLNRSSSVAVTDDNDDNSHLPAAAAGVSSLKRKHDELIYVRIGTTEHEAFELENPANPGEHDTVWVEWAISRKKECIYRHQIVRGGLPTRKRRPPPK